MGDVSKRAPARRRASTRPWCVGLCLAAASCAAGVSADGPLGGPTATGTLCTPMGTAAVATDGFVALRNHSSHPVTLRSVSLRKPKGLELRGSYVATIKGNTLLGVVPGRPPGTATALAGAVLPAHADRNLLLELRLTRAHTIGSTGGVEVRYRVGSKDYRWVSRLDVQLSPGPTCSHDR